MVGVAAEPGDVAVDPPARGVDAAERLVIDEAMPRIEGHVLAEADEIAAALSMTGGYEAYGAGSLEGIQFAVEEANASGTTPQIELKLYDNATKAERAVMCQWICADNVKGMQFAGLRSFHHFNAAGPNLSHRITIAIAPASAGK